MDEQKLKDFAEMVEKQQFEFAGEKWKWTYPQWQDAYKVHIIEKKKYTNIDVGASGKFMVENETGDIYGIKGYGVINRKKHYGNLETINKWYWGEYAPIHKNNVKFDSDEEEIDE